MKSARLMLGLFMAAPLTGCVAGIGSRNFLIEAGEPRPGDSDYARMLAMKLTARAPARTAAPRSFLPATKDDQPQ